MDIYIILVEDDNRVFPNRCCFRSYAKAKEHILREETYREIEDLGVFEGKYTTAKIKKVVLED